jgi:AMMECR1 domain-containing protein
MEGFGQASPCWTKITTLRTCAGTPKAASTGARKTGAGADLKAAAAAVLEEEFFQEISPCSLHIWALTCTLILGV